MSQPITIDGVADTFRHQQWCDHPIFSNVTEPGHVCSGWLISIEGANMGVVDGPDGALLTLYGSAVEGEIRIPVGAAETVASVLAALGHTEQADLVRTALGLLGEYEPVKCEYCGRVVPDLRRPTEHASDCPGPIPISTCDHLVKPCECAEGGDE